MSHRILLIDESVMLRRITANLLRSQAGRHEVVAAVRSAEGFARACVGDIDLVLLDYQLAGLAHAELCSRLWEEPRTCRIPTVLLVGHGVQPPALASLPPNVIETLTKPIAPEQLAGLVNTIVGFKRANLSLEDIRVSLHPGGVQEAASDLAAPQATSPPQRSSKTEKPISGVPSPAFAGRRASLGVPERRQGAVARRHQGVFPVRTRAADFRPPVQRRAPPLDGWSGTVRSRL